MATKTSSKKQIGTKKSTSKPISVSHVVSQLISKYQCLPTSVVRDYAQRSTNKRFSQEVITDVLRKLYSNGHIDRLTRGVYCVKGLL